MTVFDFNSLAFSAHYPVHCGLRMPDERREDSNYLSKPPGKAKTKMLSDDQMQMQTECTAAMAAHGLAPRVSIIVINYQRLDLLDQCLSQIALANMSITYEVIVVDNASKNWDCAIVRRHFPKAVIIENERNLLYAHANNQALRLARGQYCLLLNSDAFLEAGVVEGLVNAMDAREDVAAVGPLVRNIDGTLQTMGESFPSAWKELQSFLFVNVIKRTGSKILRGKSRACGPFTIAEVDWVSGCCWMLRRKVVEQIGGLCEELGFYDEEVEWCFRARAAGHKILCERTLSVVHLGGASTEFDKFGPEKGAHLIQADVAMFDRTIGLGRGRLICGLDRMIALERLVTAYCSKARRSRLKEYRKRYAFMRARHEKVRAAFLRSKMYRGG